MIIFNPDFDRLGSGKITLDVLEKNPGDHVVLPFYYYKIYCEDREIGKISIRIGNNYHSYFNGHVGYEINATERGHHYSLEALRLVLPVARFHGMKNIYLTCKESNVASRRIIELAGAELIEVAKIPEDYFAWYPEIENHCIYQLGL